jgi:hypothetical protein
MRTMTKEDSAILEIVSRVLVESGHGPDPSLEDACLKLMAQRCYSCLVRANDCPEEESCDCSGTNLAHEPGCSHRIKD